MVKEIESVGGKAIAIQADATDAKAVNAAVEQTVTTFGRLDILVNNAGTAIPKPFEDATWKSWTRSSTSTCAACSSPPRPRSSICRMAGASSRIGSCVGERNMTPGLAAYAATKGAVKMFTQGLVA